MPGPNVTFEKQPNLTERVTDIYTVRSAHNQTNLGVIKWHAPWRRYAYHSQGEHVILDSACMREVVEHLNKLMAARVR
jgi:hypothetical protein